MLTGCYSNRQIGLLQERDGIPTYDSVPYEPYRLHVNDEIVYRLITMDQTLSKALAADQQVNYQYAVSYRIQSDGTVDIPFLQPIRLLGLTEREAQDTLQAYFRQIIPDADVKLALYNKYFTVLGDLGSGQYKIYKERMTIFQALAMTGDVNNKGDRKHVRIVRPNGNEPPEVLEFDIRYTIEVDHRLQVLLYLPQRPYLCQPRTRRVLQVTVIQRIHRTDNLLAGAARFRAELYTECEFLDSRKSKAEN